MRTVTFLPSYRKIDVERGTTILDAAQRAGLNMNVVCGGQGKCGKCVVYIQSGRTEFDTQKYGQFFSADELAKGACLACKHILQCYGPTRRAADRWRRRCTHRSRCSGRSPGFCAIVTGRSPGPSRLSPED